MIPVWLIKPLIALALLVAAYGGGRWHQYQRDSEKQMVLRLEATEQARQKEADWQVDVQALIEVQNEEKLRIAADRDRLAASLRDRPRDRLPETSTCTADGKGATGRQLSRDDAEFLAGFAAERDRLATDLRACQKWIDAVTSSDTRASSPRE